MKLQAKTREIVGSKVKNLRKEGLIPAVLYGKGIENVNLTLNAKEFLKAYREAGESTVLDLEIDGKNKTNVLIYDIASDPVSDEIIHADLYQVDMTQEVTTDVPLVFVGESQAVKEGGVLVKNMHEVEVSALPKDLPHEIEVDLSALATIDDIIKIEDIKLPTGVKITLGGDEVVVSVTPPRSQEELDALSEEVTPVDVGSVKVESEEKKEKESSEKDK